jgi:N-acetylglutamate synthase-like GNAT family acetyltransferase
MKRPRHRASVSDRRPYTLRRATITDAPAIAALLAEVFGEQAASFTPRALAASTPNCDAIRERIAIEPVWLVEDDQHVVGTVSVTARRPTLLVRSLAVAAAARGAGVGAGLLTAVEQHAAEHGFAELELNTTPFQAAAARLYARFGFLPVDRHVVYGTPMIRMTKGLR